MIAILLYNRAVKLIKEVFFMITSKWIMGAHDLQDAHDIRRVVFIDEQGVSSDEEFDDLDDRAFHLII